MATYIALLRGINVGGKHSLPMKQLVQAMEAIGLKDVRTYIQSGNAVFRSPLKKPSELPRQLAIEISKQAGFEPHIQILTLDSWIDAIARNPFPEAETDPASLHLFFLATRATHPDLEKLGSLSKPSERFHLDAQVFYLHAPEGIGRSRLAAGVERLLGVPMTGRNWNTVCRIRNLADE